VIKYSRLLLARLVVDVREIRDIARWESVDSTYSRDSGDKCKLIFFILLLHWS
jgi:hypothetical protein